MSLAAEVDAAEDVVAEVVAFLRSLAGAGPYFAEQVQRRFLQVPVQGAFDDLEWVDDGERGRTRT